MAKLSFGEASDHPKRCGDPVASLCLAAPGRVEEIIVSSSQVYELYTGSCGLYMCLMIVRAITLVVAWCKLGWTQVLTKLKNWAVVGMTALVCISVVAVVVPLLVGILVETVLVLPIRVPLHQTPVIFLWEVRRAGGVGGRRWSGFKLVNLLWHVASDLLSFVSSFTQLSFRVNATPLVFLPVGLLMC